MYFSIKTIISGVYHRAAEAAAIAVTSAANSEDQFLSTFKPRCADKRHLSRIGIVLSNYIVNMVNMVNT